VEIVLENSSEDSANTEGRLDDIGSVFLFLLHLLFELECNECLLECDNLLLTLDFQLKIDRFSGFEFLSKFSFLFFIHGIDVLA